MFGRRLEGMEHRLIGVLVLRKVPSWNSLYRYGKGRFYKTNRGRLFEMKLIRMLPRLDLDKVVLEVYGDKGKRKWDIDNLFKSILDGFKGIVYNDDEQVIGIVAFKRNFDKRKIEIWIWEVLR